MTIALIILAGGLIADIFWGWIRHSYSKEGESVWQALRPLVGAGSVQ